MLPIPGLVPRPLVLEMRESLGRATWVDGRMTAGHQSARVKDNQQLAETDPLARKLGAIVLDALERSPLFVSAALPRAVYPPLFNRYSGGQSFGNHVDNAIRQVTGTSERVRTDLSMTVFLSEPDEYDGGELVVSELAGDHVVKLPAGDAFLYPATSVHHVRPVTRGERLASFFWIQSMVRDAGERALLLELDLSIQRLATDAPSSAAGVRLTGVYHNLLRRWADA